MKVSVDKAKDAEKKIKKMSQSELEAVVTTEVQKMLSYHTKDMLCLVSFFEFLSDENKDKAFLTNKDSMVAKKKNVLKRLHNCNIKIMGAKK
jgi:hypothetical protein